MNTGLAQIHAQLDALSALETRTRVVAIRAAKPISDPPTLDRRGRRYDLRWCPTSLALRGVLIEHEQRLLEDPDGPGTVVLTPLPDYAVADDLRSRLVRARIFEIRDWQVALDLFAARHVDNRLTRLDWMPEALLEASSAGFVEPSGTGFLDQDSAWSAVIRHRLALEPARPDACALMRWSLRPESVEQLQGMPARIKQDLFEWWMERGDPALSAVLRAMSAGFVGDLAPLGFVCSVLYAPASAGNTALIQAAARVERYFGDRPLSAREGEAWAREAVRLGGRLEPDVLTSVLVSAERLLREILASEYIYMSDWLPSGFEQRLHTFGVALDQALAVPMDRARLLAVEKEFLRVQAHRSHRDHPERVDRARMAIRLLRALQVDVTASAELSTQALQHVDHGAWVDWARFALLGGDESAVLSQAYGKLRALAAERREHTSLGFSGALQQSAGTPHDHPRIVPVEDILSRVVAPLAASRRNVLLLVVDGLSVAIHRELFAGLHRHGWIEQVRQEERSPLVGMAMLPTVTEISRCSLLAGRRMRGTSGAEKNAFASHEGLQAASASSRPPRLFHKGDLVVDGDLAPAFLAAIEDSQQRVVGVVHNAVDDHLSGPQQLSHRWSLERLRWLLPILRAALDAGRILVVTADHGHVLEDDSAVLSGGSGAPRWRPGAASVSSGEIVVTGPRVLAPEGEGPIVCLWSEKLRYSGRQTGYHGGASPAEVLVPLSIYAPADVSLPGFEPAPPLEPIWWNESEAAAIPAPAVPSRASAPAASVKAGRRKPADEPGQPQLFEKMPEAAPAPLADWMAQLFESPLFVQQRQLAARLRQSDDELRMLLTALSERGGKLGRAALAQHLKIADMRLGGFLTSARRLLNVDQSPVLTVDDMAGVVELNLPLLARQFGLRGVPGVTR